MRRKEPPPLAIWLLEHLSAGRRDEALTGDLLEEFHTGRARAWFWRQAITAAVIGLILSVFRRRMALAFAILWSLVSPGWDVLVIRFDHRSDFAGFIWRMPWPWSTLCDFSWASLETLVFVWIGALAYMTLLVILRRRVNIRSLVLGIGLSIIGYCAASACWIAAVTLMLPMPPFRVVDWHTLTWWYAIANLGIFGIAPYIPNIVAIMCALWRTESSSGYPVGLAN